MNYFFCPRFFFPLAQRSTTPYTQHYAVNIHAPFTYVPLIHILKLFTNLSYQPGAGHDNLNYQPGAGHDNLSCQHRPVIFPQRLTSVNHISTSAKVNGQHTIYRSNKRSVAFVLFKWCWSRKHGGKVCPKKYNKFVVTVCNHLIGSSTTKTPTKTPTATTGSSRSSSSESTSTVRYRARVVVNRNCKRKLNPYEGPGGEDNKPLKRALCVGADLMKQTQQRKNEKGVVRKVCAYCSSAFTKRKRTKTAWMCELCSTPLCVGCNFKYHRWVNDE